MCGSKLGNQLSEPGLYLKKKKKIHQCHYTSYEASSSVPLGTSVLQRAPGLYKSLISVRAGENGNILGGAGELAHPESFTGKSALGAKKE